MGRPLYSSSGVSRVYTQLILVLRLFLLVLSAVDLSFIGPCSSTTRRQARARAQLLRSVEYDERVEDLKEEKSDTNENREEEEEEEDERM